MAFPGKKPTAKPLIKDTDLYRHKFYHDIGQVSFHKQRIRMGEIVPDKQAKFNLRLIDYQNDPDALDTLIDTLVAWRNHWKKNR